MLEKQRRENKRKEERSLSKKETSPPKEGKGGLLPGEEYEYESMLDRIYLLLQTNNQDLIMNKKKFINPPHVIKLSGKRSSWINFHVKIHYSKGIKNTPSCFIFFLQIPRFYTQYNIFF